MRGNIGGICTLSTTFPSQISTRLGPSGPRNYPGPPIQKLDSQGPADQPPKSELTDQIRLRMTPPRSQPPTPDQDPGPLRPLWPEPLPSKTSEPASRTYQTWPDSEPLRRWAQPLRPQGPTNLSGKRRPLRTDPFHRPDLSD